MGFGGGWALGVLAGRPGGVTYPGVDPGEPALVRDGQLEVPGGLAPSIGHGEVHPLEPSSRTPRLHACTPSVIWVTK